MCNRPIIHKGFIKAVSGFLTREDILIIKLVHARCFSRACLPDEAESAPIQDGIAVIHRELYNRITLDIIRCHARLFLQIKMFKAEVEAPPVK